MEQVQARSATQTVMEASEHALVQAAQLKAEQERTSQQVTDILTTQVDDTQKQVQSATKIAMQTQHEVQTSFALPRIADLVAKMVAEKIERQMEAMQQQMQAQKALSLQEAEAAQVAQATIPKQLEEAQRATQATANLCSAMKINYQP